MTAEQEEFIRNLPEEKVREINRKLVVLLQQNGYADHPLVKEVAAGLEPRTEEQSPSDCESLP